MSPQLSETDSLTNGAVLAKSTTVAASRHVLVIEDNPADVRLVQEALRSLEPSVSVSVVHNGEDALGFLTRSGRFQEAVRPNLVFLDFHLPKTEPGEILVFIKQHDRLRDIAVVVLTTSDSEELISQAYSLGANGYLVKPSDLDSFLRTVKGAASYWLNFPKAEDR